MPMLGIGAAIGAALAYFFDPQNGKRRRNMTRDRTLALLRRGGGRAGQYAAQAQGMKQKATHLHEERKDLDDVTLARKVETEIFRPADAPKGSVDVNVVDGVVQLRGEVDSPDLVDELVSTARSVQGVRDVENLLHLPGETAPMHE
jgi:osmotically-inducible protein OsmY